MARAKKTKRGSPEAIAKRRAARALNRVFDEGGSPAAMDGRTLKRKKRLIKELKEGKGGKPLKAHEVLGHVDELLSLGETLTSIRRMKPLTPPTPPMNAKTVEIIQRTQDTYGFDPKSWKVLGVDLDKVLGGNGARGGKKKTARKKATRKKKTTRKKK
jgi:hypothetical protein